MIFINNGMDRAAFLFGKILNKIIGLNIQYFSVDDIYNFINTDAFLIIGKNNAANKHLHALLEEIKEQDVKIKCKIILLGADLNVDIPNVYPISQCLLVDETREFKSNVSENFILINLQKSTKEHIQKIEHILYPHNKEIAVKIINNPEFSHCQNLGLCTEEMIMDLIERCEYFVDVNGLYLFDAINANKKIVDINNLSENLSLSNLDEHTINKKEYIKDTEQLRISKIIERII